MSVCNYCLSTNPRTLCGACKAVSYCNANCQKNDWKSPRQHKATCGQVPTELSFGLRACGVAYKLYATQSPINMPPSYDSGDVVIPNNRSMTIAQFHVDSIRKSIDETGQAVLVLKSVGVGNDIVSTHVFANRLENWRSSIDQQLKAVEYAIDSIATADESTVWVRLEHLRDIPISISSLPSIDRIVADIWSAICQQKPSTVQEAVDLVSRTIRPMFDQSKSRCLTGRPSLVDLVCPAFASRCDAVLFFGSDDFLLFRSSDTRLEFIRKFQSIRHDESTNCAICYEQTAIGFLDCCQQPMCVGCQMACFRTTDVCPCCRQEIRRAVNG